MLDNEWLKRTDGFLREDRIQYPSFSGMSRYVGSMESTWRASIPGPSIIIASSFHVGFSVVYFTISFGRVNQDTIGVITEGFACGYT